jgi:dUTP pyrophosphatase
MVELHLAVPDAELRSQYIAAATKYNERALEERDSGFDVYCSEESYLSLGDTVFLKFGIDAACVIKPGSVPYNRAYWLMPRSSISKTPFVCANSMGLIDSGYRGALMGAIKMVTGEGLKTITVGTRLFQVVSGSAKPWSKVVIVESVADLPKPSSERGSGGFGSTGQGV